MIHHRWLKIVLKSATNQVMTVWQEVTIKFTEICFCCKINCADYTISELSLQTCICYTSYLIRRGPERNFKHDLAFCIIKFYPISAGIEAPKTIPFSLCDSLIHLCIYSASQISAIGQFHHYSQFLCWRSMSKHYKQEAQDKSSEFH